MSILQFVAHSHFSIVFKKLCIYDDFIIFFLCLNILISNGKSTTQINQNQSDRYKSAKEPANEQMEKVIENEIKMNSSHELKLELVTVDRYYIENKRSSKYRKEECE